MSSACFFFDSLDDGVDGARILYGDRTPDCQSHRIPNEWADRIANGGEYENLA